MVENKKRTRLEKYRKRWDGRQISGEGGSGLWQKKMRKQTSESQMERKYERGWRYIVYRQRRNGVWRTGDREKVKEYPGLQPLNSPLQGWGWGKAAKVISGNSSSNFFALRYCLSLSTRVPPAKVQNPRNAVRILSYHCEYSNNVTGWTNQKPRSYDVSGRTYSIRYDMQTSSESFHSFHKTESGVFFFFHGQGMKSDHSPPFNAMVKNVHHSPHTPL